MPLPPRVEVVDSDAGRIRIVPEEPARLPLGAAGRLALSESDAPEPRVASAVLVLSGLALLLLGIPAFVVAGFVLDQIGRNAWLGWSAAAVAAAGFGLLFWAAGREVAALFRLRSMDAIRAELARPEPGRRLAALRRWAAHLDTVGQPSAAAALVADPDAALALMRAGPGAALRGRADALGRTAAIQVAAGIAAVPSPSLDALLVAWRALRLVREVAALYGMRPGLIATLALLRRTLLAATLVGGVEAATNAAASALLSNPLLGRLAGEVAGAGVAARRMLVLARAAAAACDPLPPE